MKKIKAKITRWFRGDIERQPIVLMETKKWIRCVVTKEGDDKYGVFIYNRKAKTMKLIKSKPQEFYEDVYIEEDMGYPVDQMYSRYNSYNWHTNDRIFKQLISHFEHGVTLRASRGNILSLMKNKDYNKFMVDKYVKMSKAELFTFCCAKEGMPQAGFEKLFGEIDLEKELSGADGMQAVKYGQSLIVMTPDLKVDLADVKKLVNQAGRRIRKIGAGKVMKARITVLKNMAASGHNVLADYVPSDGGIRLKAKNAKLDSDHLHSLIHELGHKFHYEFMSMEARKEVSSKFRELSGNSISVNIGEKLIDDDTGEVYKVVEKGSRRNYSAVLLETDNVKKKGLMFKIPGSMIGTRMMPENNSNPDIKKWFVSPYSRTSEHEFFAEMFADYATKGLAKETEEWIKSLI